MGVSTKPVKIHPAKRRKRKGSSKWVKKTAALKHYNVQNTAKKSTPLSYSKYTKYQHVLKPKAMLPKHMIEITPNTQHPVTLSYLVFLMVIITGSAITIGVVAAGGGKNLFPGLTGGPSFTISASVGQYAVYQTTMNGQTSYDKYVVTAIDTSNANRIVITFDVYNSSSPDDFSGSPRTTQINVTNTATDVSVSGAGFAGAGGTPGSYRGGGGGNFGGGNFGGGNYGGNGNYTPPSGGFGGFQGRGGFGGLTGTQVLVAEQSDFTTYQSQLESQSSGAASGNTITVTTQTKSVQMTTTGSTGSMTMDRDMEYSPNGLLLKSTTTTSFNGNTITTETDLMGDYSNIPQ